MKLNQRLFILSLLHLSKVQWRHLLVGSILTAGGISLLYLPSYENPSLTDSTEMSDRNGVVEASDFQTAQLVPSEKSLYQLKLNVDTLGSLNAETLGSSSKSKTEDLILTDYQGRISPEFSIPKSLYQRTKFWFRVYTEYDSTKKIIHASTHPHVVFDVVDITPILALPTRARWLNVAKADKHVAQRVSEIRAKLKRMATKSESQMDEEELRWLVNFNRFRGGRKQVILEIANSLRVQTGQKDFFEKGLTLSGRYLPSMEAIFKSKGLPTELTRLPFVESSFVNVATSKVGASGIWQFMPGIGGKLMMVNDQIDERRNPLKSTEAAARLLKENYTILKKNWGLALTAYNHGPGGVRKAMETAGTKDIAKIIHTYRTQNFDFASSNFFTCFLAAAYAQHYRDLIWPDHIYEPAVNLEPMKLARSYTPGQLKRLTSMTAEQITMFNPDLEKSFKFNQKLPQGLKVYLPMGIKVSAQKVLPQNIAPEFMFVSQNEKTKSIADKEILRK